jgi:acetolactate synthase-1/2/3 large subunit
VGAVNLAAGLQDARLSCSPVVAVTGREHQSNQQRHAYQEVDHVDPFSAVAKYSAFVSRPEELPVYLRQAFRCAATGSPGPAHLDLEGIAGQTVVDREADLDAVVEEMFARVPPFRPEAESEALLLLTKAERPVIVAGGGVTASGAGAELVALSEKLFIPVATSLNAKTMLPWDHPLAVGVPGSYSRECANRVLSEADLLHRQPHRRTGHQLLHRSTTGNIDRPARYQPRGIGPQLPDRTGHAGRCPEHAAQHDRPC